MDPGEIYVRTELGQSDLKKANLDPAARVVFFMIDGTTPVADILSQVSGLGVTDATVEQLQTLGFIAPKPKPAPATAAAPAPKTPAPEPDRVFVARQFLNETAVNAVGLRSYFFTLKLERAWSLAELRLLLPDYEKIVAKTGRIEGELLLRRARELTAERPRS